jgi:hypothetical protein
MRMSEAALERVKSIRGWAQYGEKMYEVFSELTGRSDVTPLHIGGGSSHETTPAA